MSCLTGTYSILFKYINNCVRWDLPDGAGLQFGGRFHLGSIQIVQVSESQMAVVTLAECYIFVVDAVQVDIPGMGN